MPTSVLLMLAFTLPLQTAAHDAPQEPASEAGAPAAHGDARPAPDPPAKEDTGMFSTVGMFTLGGGVLGAVVVGGLVVLSPCVCGLPLACPVAAVATGAGAGIGALVASEGDVGRALLPAAVGGGVGGTAGLLAGVLALGTSVLIDSALPNPGLSAGGAAFNVGVASISAGALALVLVGAGSFAGAAATSWAFERGAQTAGTVDGGEGGDGGEGPPAGAPRGPAKEKKKQPQEPTAGDEVAMLF